MKPWKLGASLVLTVAAAAVGLAQPQEQRPAAPGGYLFLDAEGRPLPFQDHAAICVALRSGEVISREPIGRGVAGAERLVLEHDGVRFRAAFRTVDVKVESEPVSGARRPKEYRDAAIFEAAAYELSELLGLGRVPPAVPRSIDGRAGTVQVWLEATRPEVELLEQGALSPPDESAWRRQKQVMRVFDSLIANNDRNQGNLLIDADWTIWLIDHTRAFKQSSELFERDKLTSCERTLWESLRSLDDETIRLRLEPYLEGREIASLLRRREKLLDHLQGLIEKQGEERVLYNLSAPATAVRPQR
jgi:hypothetical protein